MEESDGGADSVRKGVAVVKVRLAYNPQKYIWDTNIFAEKLFC